MTEMELTSHTNPASDIPELPELRGTPIDLSEMPESAKTEFVLFHSPMRLVGLRFHEAGSIFDYDAGDLRLKHGDPVVAEVPEKGLFIGWVSKPPFTIENDKLKLRLPPITRVASQGDLEVYSKIQVLEREAKNLVQGAVSRMQLPMRILRVSYTLDLKKALVYFFSEERVDFRHLLRDLIHELKARVELRQVGARDETKLLGGIGPCGEETCCSRFIGKFHSVSIRMAKDQDLSLKPHKVAGNCGRLKCCLAYEEKVYAEARKSMPKRGACVKCKSTGGCGVIRDTNILLGKVLVEFEDGTQQFLPVSDLIEDKSRGRDDREKVIASADDVDDDALKKLEDRESES